MKHILFTFTDSSGSNRTISYGEIEKAFVEF